MGPYLSTAEAAPLLNAKPVTVRKLCERGAIPALKVADRWIIRRSIVEKMSKTYIAKCGRPKGWRKVAMANSAKKPRRPL